VNYIYIFWFCYSWFNFEWWLWSSSFGF
jgi:hypothetical protein